MKPVKFKEVNTEFGKGTPFEISVYRDPSLRGNKDIVACYSLNFWEKIMIVLTGTVWLNITTKDGNLRPMRMSTLKKDFITIRKQRRENEKAEKKLNQKLPGTNGLTKA